MTKFAFIKGESKRAFFADGVYYEDGRYLDYKIVGSWSPPLEDGKIPVIMEIYGYRVHVLKGTFDPEENSMRGEDTKSGQAFVFKRDPDFVRFYPSPHFNNARTRWEFATTSVLDRIRQRAWSSKRILKRMEDGRRFMEFMFQGKHWRPPRREEVVELFASFPGFYESDTRFYRSLFNLYLKKTPVFK
jgi:hypothetical protein